MKRLLLVASFATLLIATTPALAGHHGGHGRGHGNDNDQGEDWHPPGKHKGWHKDYRRGERIEVVYLTPRYYVEDYRVYHLAPPPPGHRWIRYPDGRYILVAVATGIIADILLNH
ncbi:RcnB family protein [Lysobacter fragariae]